MKLKHLIFLIGCIALIQYSSCQKCHDEQLEDYAFSSEDLSINPYKDNDTIILISLNDDTILSSCNRGSSRTYRFENHLINDGDCKGQWYQANVDWTYFVTSPQFNLTIILDPPDIFRTGNTKYFTLKLQFKDSISSYFEIGRLVFNNGALENNPFTYQTGFIESFHDSLIIGQKSFKNVYTFDSNSQTNQINKVYYSVSDGLLGFSLSNQNIYYLLRRSINFTLPNKPLRPMQPNNGI